MVIAVMPPQAVRCWKMPSRCSSAIARGIWLWPTTATLTNATELREEFELQGDIFYGTSDTEVIAHAITRARLTAPSIEAAVEAAMHRLSGAYSLVITSPRKLIATRDPMGVPPPLHGPAGGERSLLPARAVPWMRWGLSLSGTLNPARS